MLAEVSSGSCCFGGVTRVDIAAGLGEEIITDKLVKMSEVDVIALKITKG